VERIKNFAPVSKGSSQVLDMPFPRADRGYGHALWTSWFKQRCSHRSLTPRLQH